MVAGHAERARGLQAIWVDTGRDEYFLDPARRPSWPSRRRDQRAGAWFELLTALPRGIGGTRRPSAGFAGAFS
jgi:hypothetical protein